MSTAAKRARLLDMIRGSGDIITIEQYKVFADLALTNGAEPGADYDGPIRVPCEEWQKFIEAENRYYNSIGTIPPPLEAVSYEIIYSHLTRREAVEDARREYEAAPALVRHEDNLFYMHGEGKPGRPTIIGVLITEIMQ